MSACGSFSPVRSTRRNATVTISAPLASRADCIERMEENLPVPMSSRERNSRSPILHGSKPCTIMDIPPPYANPTCHSSLLPLPFWEKIGFK